LKIAGRIQEQFKTAKGEYVSPAKIEVKWAPELRQAVKSVVTV